MVTKVQWLFLKNTRPMGCVSQDMEPPKSSSILRKSSNIRKPIRCVRFTKAVLRHADIRDQNPSLGMICPGDPHLRNPNASQIWGSVSGGDRVARARCPRSSVKAGQKCVKIKGAWKSSIFSPSENWCLLAPSTLKPEEREFVVDSGASMHMISIKDLNDAEMETLTKSCSPTIVITANGEVKRQQCMSKNWTCSWLWKSSKTRQQHCRLESFEMKTDILMNGSMVKTTSQ